MRQEVKAEVLCLLAKEQWSPQQIFGRMAKEGVFISHETRYKMIRKDKKQGGSLYMNCRHRLRHRFRHIGGKRIPIPNRTSIRERSKEADGKRFGDWKKDTIVGKILMRKLPKGKNAKETALTVVWLLEPFKPYVKTITADNGTEFAHHKYITDKFGVTVYFADPHAPWHKGVVKNENGLVWQYLPKWNRLRADNTQKTKMSEYKINTRPREKLNFSNSLEGFYKKIL